MALTLERLIDRRRLDDLLEAAAVAAPDLTVRLVAADVPPAGNGSVRRPIVADGQVLGAIEVQPVDLGAGPDGRAGAHAELLGRSIELAAGEGLARRAVAGAALDDLRELALVN
ncbi:MAG TPA: hypothetical protein VFI34_08635, partial [Candidatus Limnocylindrales bacterium]|nr:hypothetical protein [Candidatus Limnocylindrales bacterium]